MTAVVVPAQIVQYATAEELKAAQRFVEDLVEYGDDDVAWSVGIVCSIRPDPERERTNLQFIELVHRLARSQRQLQRQGFGAEVDIKTSYERRDGAITECRMTISWPRRPMVLELPDRPTGAKANRGGSHNNRKRDRAA